MAAGDARQHNMRALAIGDNAGVSRHVGCNADGMLYTFPWANFAVQQDLLLNDSDKTFTVPAGHIWYVHWILINFVATATVGSREIVINVLDDSANLLGRLPSGNNIPASFTRFIQFVAGVFTNQDTSQETITGTLPSPLLLPAAYQLRIFDFIAVDAAADDMLVSLGRQEIELF